MKEGQVAKAWVLFNGQNNNLTTAYNVTSVTDVGATAGQYNINFEMICLLTITLFYQAIQLLLI